MKRYIITGTPGCGKTSLLRALELQGHFVIDEAATDIIAYEQALGVAAPWENPTFVDAIVRLQKQRQIQAQNTPLQFFDRSPICTYALSMYLNVKPSKILTDEIHRILQDKIYEKNVFFIENLGHIKPTEARTISFEEALRFEKMHEEAYEMFDFKLVRIPQGTLQARLAAILKGLH